MAFSKIQSFPVFAFLGSELWVRAKWIATTFRWHPEGKAPPVLGLVFADATAAEALFRVWIDACGHADELEELRISVIEGDIPGHPSGYSLYVAPEPDSVMVRATAEGIVVDGEQLLLFGQANRMYPVADLPAMLPRFRQEYEKHNEYLLAPVIQHPDGQYWFNVNLGIVKSAIHFRQAHEISHDDIDAAAIRPPLVWGMDSSTSE